ncbi:PTS sugar transporter subunit IIA [Peribacillus alkalitolerans]|uniref:PTS sugar transporter subunit IIA n=1 Tax=Peribacillus alkalitolerans TaxID=1550385 RepID=UPI0013D0F20D|nr:PTS glucose transporter subunit IIA [Peribacillus alkalitolerans]
MFKKLFGKKTEQAPDVLVSPATGRVIPLEEVPDPVFAEKMMGDGLAIEPTEGVIVAPIDGKVLQVFPTKHAIGLKTDAGTEILIHIGLETVGMKGEGFEAHVKEGDLVKKGDTLVIFDLNLVREKAKSLITPIIITNTAEMKSFKKASTTELTKGETTFITVTPNR